MAREYKARIKILVNAIGTVNDIICCPGFDFCALANATSIDVAEDIHPESL